MALSKTIEHTNRYKALRSSSFVAMTTKRLAVNNAASMEEPREGMDIGMNSTSYGQTDLLRNFIARMLNTRCSDGLAQANSKRDSGK